MNKKILLSLALVATIPLTSFASVGVSNMKVEGNIGLMSTTSNDSNRNLNAFKADSSLVGGYVGLKVKGDVFEHASFGISLTGVDSLNHRYNIQGPNKTDAVIEEVYLKYKTENNVFKVGRTNFDSPLIFSSDFKPISNSYDMISISNKSLKDTYLFGGIILRANTVESLDFTGMNKPLTNKTSPIGVIGGLYSGIKQFPVQLWVYGQDKGMQAIYASTDSKFTTDLNLGLQYSYSNNGSLDSSESISMLGANLNYNINKYWLVDISFNQVSKGDDTNSPVNLSDEHSSKLYTFIRGVSEFMGRDEASLSDTTSFSIKANGKLHNGYGDLGLYVGTYHHLSPTSYNSNSNTTHTGQISWSNEVYPNLLVKANVSYVNYETVDTNGLNKRNDGQYYSLRLNYSF